MSTRASPSGSTLTPQSSSATRQARPLLVVEMDGPARPDRVELLNDRVAPGDGFELLEQCVPLVPADLDDFPRYVDLHSVESARFHLKSPGRWQAIDTTRELLADVFTSRVSDSRNCVLRIHAGVER